MKKKSKKIVIALVIVIILVIVGIIGFNLYKNSNKLKVDIVDKVDIELNDEYYNTNGIKNIKNGEVITEKDKIDSSKLGSQEITLVVKDKFNKEKEYKYTINVVDNEKPVIDNQDKIEITEGKKIDLLKDVVVTDNSGEDINATVEGEYNINKAGTYTLYYVAKDSSGNETKKEFILEVKEKKVTPPVETKPSDNTGSNGNTNPIPNPTNNPDGTFTTSKGFTGTTKNGFTYINGILIANKTYSLPSTYYPGGLTKETKEAFDKMEAAAKLDGIYFSCRSGFRSYDTQKRLYNNYVVRDGKAAADTYSARPGNSEHQTGLACDICSNDNSRCINSGFNNTAEAKWAANNAYKYGLILRYPEGKSNETGYKYESWHFRYVGVDLATKLYNNGDWITLESYFGITSQYK